MLGFGRVAVGKVMLVVAYQNDERHDEIIAALNRIAVAVEALKVKPPVVRTKVVR